MKINVDWNRCEGHGMCEERAPEVFSLDENGDLVYHFEGSEVPAEQQSLARGAVAVCPVAALRLVE